MKYLLFPVILLGSAMMTMAQDKPKTPAETKPTPQFAFNQKAFLNLPEERRTEFGKHLAEADRLFRDKRVFETIDEIEKANVIFQDSPELLNLRGSCYVEFRAFDKAMTAYRAAEKLSPENSSIAFNIGEVLFVTKKWQSALDLFEKVLKTMNEKTDLALMRLIEFKIQLCKIKLGRKEEAEILAEKYDFMDDSPYYYFAHGALCYMKGDLVKAEEWLSMAGRVFQNPSIVAPWQDTLVEFGYIKSFYGDDAAVGK
jgi:tetratricopeptide (TPR) repeat protein